MYEYVRTISNDFININDETINFSNKFYYKGYTAYDLIWSNEQKTLDIWEPLEFAIHIDFNGTEEEYNEYVQPLVDIWEQAKLEQEQDPVLQNTLLLQKYDNAMTIYNTRLTLAINNNDIELINQLRNEMNNYDPKINTQSIEQLQHYCKKCGHELNEMNICTNENCKRKELQENIIQAINIQAINIQTINQE